MTPSSRAGTVTEDSRSAIRRRQREIGGEIAAAAPEFERDLGARRLRAHDRLDVGHRIDVAALYGFDDIAGVEAGAIGRTARLHFGDRGSGVAVGQDETS